MASVLVLQLSNNALVDQGQDTVTGMLDTHQQVGSHLSTACAYNLCICKTLIMYTLIFKSLPAHGAFKTPFCKSCWNTAFIMYF